MHLRDCRFNIRSLWMGVGLPVVLCCVCSSNRPYDRMRSNGGSSCFILISLEETVMKIFLFILMIGTPFGYAAMLMANRFRTPEHPVWYRASLQSFFGWNRRDWWTPTGYRLHILGSILLIAGGLACAIYYLPLCFSN